MSRPRAFAAMSAFTVCLASVAPTAMVQTNPLPVRPQPTAALTAADRLITPTSIGPITLGTTLSAARRAHPSYTFTRASDGEGVALVEAVVAPGHSILIYAGEESPDAPIDWSARIQRLETTSPLFVTREGIHAAALVRELVRTIGEVTEIVESEIEARQFITFAKQPAWLTLRLDYTGRFPRNSRTTTRHEPNARIFSVAIAAQ